LTMKFDAYTNLLFSGKTKVSDGKFSFTFLVPRDIDYSYGEGRISYYASNNYSDMNGSFTDFLVGGFAENSFPDTSGPLISLFMNDTLFRDGGITGSNPTLLAIIEDKGGINTTGAGIGHDLAAYLDNDRNKSFVLNNFFETDVNNYSKGRLYYNLNDLRGGPHTITLKAWDNFNNSSEETINFIVEDDGKIILSDLICYPNPVSAETRITAGHNRPNGNLKIVIDIHDMSGRKIRRLESTAFHDGFQTQPIIWDATNEYGTRVSGGIYIYNISITTDDGETARASGRMIIL